HYESEVVIFKGGCYQASQDTGESPDNRNHWRCLAAPGRDAKSFRHRGTYTQDSHYEAFDLVALNGSTFLCLHSAAGLCPGEGWQLVSAPGKRGAAGDRGPQGERGPSGVAGPPGKDAAQITGWRIDRASYAAFPMMSDGTDGPPLELRALFEQFQ